MPLPLRADYSCFPMKIFNWLLHPTYLNCVVPQYDVFTFLSTWMKQIKGSQGLFSTLDAARLVVSTCFYSINYTKLAIPHVHWRTDLRLIPISYFAFRGNTFSCFSWQIVGICTEYSYCMHSKMSFTNYILIQILFKWRITVNDTLNSIQGHYVEWSAGLDKRWITKPASVRTETSLPQFA